MTGNLNESAFPFADTGKGLVVGFDAHVLDGKPQGSRTVIYRLAEAFARLCPEAKVLLYAQNIPASASGGPANLEYRKGAAGNPLVRLFRFFPKINRRDRPTALIFQYISSPLVQNGCVFIHDILPISHPQLFSLRFVVRCSILFIFSMMFSKSIVVVSKYTFDEVRARLPFFSNKLSVVRNGPSFSSDVYFSDSPVSASPAAIRGRRYILSVGRIERRKNIDMLIRAFRDACLEDVDLVIVGKLDMGFTLRESVGGGVIWLENIDDQELISLHRSAALFVYASLAEGFGLPLLDSILFGAPTLSSSQTAMPEVANGLAELFDPTSPDAEKWLSTRIQAHFGDQPVAAPTLEARKAHAENFSWEASARALARTLRGTDKLTGRWAGEGDLPNGS